MKTYVASINGNAVLAFRAEDDDQARAIIDDPEGGMRSDLLTLIGADGRSLWDGKSAIQAREATPAQHAEWEQSRDQAISDGKLTWMRAMIRMNGTSIDMKSILAFGACSTPPLPPSGGQQACEQQRVIA
jgi:hypothetical protein